MEAATFWYIESSTDRIYFRSDFFVPLIVKSEIGILDMYLCDIA